MHGEATVWARDKARRYHPGATRFVRCEIEVETMVPLGDKVKSPRCRVICEVDMHGREVGGESPLRIERVREAARVLREHAREATDGPWQRDTIYQYKLVTTAPGMMRQTIGHAPGMEPLRPNRVRSMIESTSSANGDYIALMHPGVALALARWLDGMWRVMVGTNPGEVPFEEDAIAVADQVLGPEQP